MALTTASGIVPRQGRPRGWKSQAGQISSAKVKRRRQRLPKRLQSSAGRLPQLPQIVTLCVSSCRGRRGLAPMFDRRVCPLATQTLEPHPARSWRPRHAPGAHAAGLVAPHLAPSALTPPAPSTSRPLPGVALSMSHPRAALGWGLQPLKCWTAASPPPLIDRRVGVAVATLLCNTQDTVPPLGRGTLFPLAALPVLARLPPFGVPFPETRDRNGGFSWWEVVVVECHTPSTCSSLQLGSWPGRFPTLGML